MPTIPVGEYRERWEKVQELMDRKGLDLFLAYADDHAVFGPAYARWLANFPVHFEPICILMSRDKEPILLCGAESDGYAMLVGQIPDVRILEEFTHPDEDYLHTRIQNLQAVAADLVDIKSIKKIGIAGQSLLGAYAYLKSQQAFPNAQWVDIEHDMSLLRAKKSKAELEVIRYAYGIAQRGMQAAMDAIRAGAIEREVAAIVEYTMRMAGAEGTGIDTMIGSGDNSRHVISRTTFREIQEGDIVQVTIAPRYEGYHGAVARPIFVGEPKDEALHALEAAHRAQLACYRAIRPGIEGREVEAIGRKIMDEANLGKYFQYSGIHSIGIMEFEPPIFGPTQDDKLEEGMTISVDIPVFGAPWGGFRLEDGYLVTANGAERLNLTDYFVIK